MYNTLLVVNNGAITTITINRPDKLNALNKEVFAELNDVIDTFILDANQRAAIITGAGTKAFVAGADITEFTGLSSEEATLLSMRGQQLFNKIEQSPKPIVAAVNGFALGGGCELAMACHFRIASDNAKFGQPEVNLGLLPGYGGTQRLTQLIGKGRALELIFSAVLINAATALQYGLVNHVVPQEDLLNKAMEVLQTINTKAPLAIAATIQAANDAYESNGKGYTTEANAFGHLIATDDAKEGVAAFLEKRAANFTGK